MDLWPWRRGLFNYRCGGSHLRVLLRFLFLRSTPFYIYVLNGIQLNLQSFWQREVRLTPITVEELEFIHRAPMRPYVRPQTCRRLTYPRGRAIAACMQGLLLLLLALMPSAVGLSSALSPHLRPQSFLSQQALFSSKNTVSHQGTRTVQNGITHFSANEKKWSSFSFLIEIF